MREITVGFRQSEEKLKNLLFHSMRKFGPDAKKVISEQCQIDEQIIEMWLSGERIPHIGTFHQVLKLLEPDENYPATSSKWNETCRFIAEVTFVHMALTKSVSDYLPEIDQTERKDTEDKQDG